MDQEKIKEYLVDLQDWAVVFAPKLIAALLVLWIGLKIATKLSQVFGKAIEKSGLDMEISEFLKSMVETMLKILVFMIAASIIGIKMTALLGLLAALGLAVGMALQGFLGNFASGLAILFIKPYRVGDWVQIEDNLGKVTSIQIFNTTLLTHNDETLIIPNGQITDNIITNFSSQGNIRIELNVNMPYEESYPNVQSIIEGALSRSQYALKDPKPLIGIETYDTHYIVIAVRPYINPDNLWEAQFEILGLIKKAFHENNIKAAYSEGVELGPIGK